MNSPFDLWEALPNDFGGQTLQTPKQAVRRGRPSLKSPKAFVQIFIFSQSFLCHHCWGVSVDVCVGGGVLGEAIRTPHISVFPPRLIYL